MGEATPPRITPSEEPDRYIHSDIFDRLVRHENDLTGLVAYSLYQRSKRGWIKQFRAKRQRMPSVAEVQDYSAVYQDAELNDLRNKAEGIIVGVAEGLIEERQDQLRDNAFNARAVQEIERLKAAIDRISGYRHHIIGHIAGFFCLVILYVALTWAVDHEPSVVTFLRGHL